MVLDLKALKESLDEKGYSYHDGGYLEPDLKLLYDEYKGRFDKPDRIKEYFETHEDFIFEEFLKAFIEDHLQMNVSIEYDAEGWMIIKSVSNGE